MGDYYFNDACILPYTDRASAKAHLTDLLAGLAAIDAESEQLPQFRLSKDPWELVLGEENGLEFSLGSLAHELYNTLDHEHAAYFDSLVHLMPGDGDLSEGQVEAVLRLEPLEAHSAIPETFPSVQAADIASRICALTGSALVSLCSSDRWRFDQLGFAVAQQEFLLNHVGTADHAKSIVVRMRKGELVEITSSKLWSNRKRLFPNLLFAPSVQKNLDTIATALFPLLLKRLAAFDEMAHRWKVTGAFPSDPLRLKPETEMTMKNYGTQRRFKSAKGSLVVFEEHVTIDGLHRVHVFRHEGTKELEIGYIGRHLSTMLYST